jgi:formylglycine-generating enzyme required for sulfatase activity
MDLAFQSVRFSLHSTNVMKPALTAQGFRHCLSGLLAALTVACVTPLGTTLAADAPDRASAPIPAPDLVEHFQSDQDITNSLGMVLVSLPAGYRVAQHEVTQSAYQTVMGVNPSRFQGAQRPVERVSWNQAREFCHKLTESERDKGALPDGYAYTLPTQAQWTFFVGDAELKDAITSHLGDRVQTEAVGGLGPNQYNLYDVRGNVWEWCSDPVARGGSWRSHEDFLGVDFRFVGTPDAVYDDIGFRVILQATSPSANR